MPADFPGGVRDPEGRRGFVIIAPHRVAAVDLADGTLLWLKEGLGQPIGATGEHLITIGPGKGSPVIRIIEAAKGDESQLIALPGLPEWVVREAVAGGAVRLDAMIDKGQLKLVWKGRQPYRGGAAPTREIAEESSAETSGGVHIDLASGKVLPAPPGEAAVSPMAEPESAQDFGALTKSIPGVVAMSRAGNRVFVLRNEALPGSALRIEIEARDANTGAVQWRTPLADVGQARPTPLRK